MADIKIRGMTKVYPNGIAAIRDVDLDVADGEFLVLVGPSGCGKSTLLRMVAGLEEVTGGALFIDDRDVTDAAPRDRDIAMVFQSYALYPHMTVRRNIGYPLKLAGVGASELDARVLAAARTLQLESVLDRKPGQLSGGQRQRVAMGRAIVRNPSAFLMDEPLSNLDAKLRVQMRAEIARLQREFETTTIYVTHDQVEAMTMGDRVAVLNGGRVEQCDSPRQLYDRPANLFVAAFIGSPAMNLFTATVRPGSESTGPIVEFGGLEIPVGTDGWTNGLADWIDREITVGVRAEATSTSPFGVDAQAAPLEQRLEQGLEQGLDVTVDFIEELGSELVVHTTGSTLRRSDAIESAVTAASDHADPMVTIGSNLVTKLPPRTVLRPTDRLRVYVDPTQIHLFDPAGPSLRSEPVR